MLARATVHQSGHFPSRTLLLQLGNGDQPLSHLAGTNSHTHDPLSARTRRYWPSHFTSTPTAAQPRAMSSQPRLPSTRISGATSCTTPGVRLLPKTAATSPNSQVTFPS